MMIPIERFISTLFAVWCYEGWILVGFQEDVGYNLVTGERGRSIRRALEWKKRGAIILYLIL